MPSSVDRFQRLTDYKIRKGLVSSLRGSMTLQSHDIKNRMTSQKENGSFPEVIMPSVTALASAQMTS